MKSLYKKCKDCKEVKNTFEFSNCGIYLQSSCKNCKAVYDKKRRLDKAEEISIKSKEKYRLLSKDARQKINANRKKVCVKCRDCDFELIKRKDTLII